MSDELKVDTIIINEMQTESASGNVKISGNLDVEGSITTQLPQAPTGNITTQFGTLIHGTHRFVDTASRTTATLTESYNGHTWYYLDVPEVDINIYKTRATSKIRLTSAISLEADTAAVGTWVITRRQGGGARSLLGRPAAAGTSRNHGTFAIPYDSDDQTTPATFSWTYLDTDSLSVGEYTYGGRVYFSASGQRLAINRTDEDGAAADRERVTTTIMLEELE